MVPAPLVTPVLTRTELYDLVWSTPMATLAKRYGVAGASIAKVCDRHGIPRPAVGHWSKKAGGRKPAEAAAAADTDGAQQVAERMGSAGGTGGPHGSSN